MINPKQARLKLGLSQPEMTKAMGVARGTWLKWERGERDITAAPCRLLKTLLWLHEKGLLADYIEKFSK